MDSWDAYTSAFDKLGFDPTGVRSGSGTSGNTNRRGDPTGIDQWEFGYGGFDPLMDYGAKALDAQLAKDAQQNAWNTPGAWMSGQTGTAQGGTGNVGGDWSGVEQWSAAINASAQKWGVPVNLVKAIMKLESNGDPNAQGAPGVWGPMQVHAGVWGQGPWTYDPVANIDKGVEILKINYNQYGSWDMVIQAYLGFGEDMYGTDNNEYLAIVKSNWDQLNNAAGGAGLGMGTGSGGTSMGWDTIFGGIGVPEWGEFGAESSNGLYGYGTSYGLNGTQHTGVDVPMPIGTPYRAPASGTITCAGTGNGPGADGGGCAAFGDPIGGGVGRVELQLDNGVVLIFGHSNRSMFQPGQRVNAGDAIGLSGGMVSPHIHLEARVRDASMPSGWRIVDPRSVVGAGSYSGGGGMGGVPQSGQPLYGGYDNPIAWFLSTPGASW